MIIWLRRDLTVCKILNNVLTKYDQCIFLKEKSQEAVSSFPDNYFDIIFLDANHLYEFINTDIKNWLPKVKEGGKI